MPKIGDVILYFNEDIFPQKRKYAVCVYSTSSYQGKIGLLLINSKNRKDYHCVGPFYKREYKFLKWDSYVSCSRLFEMSPIQIEKIVGYMCKEDMGRIYEKVKTSKTLVKRHKELILKSV